MVSVVMAYKNRGPQLRATLQSMVAPPGGAEVIIVDDNSSPGQEAARVIEEIEGIRIKIMTCGPRTTLNPCVIYNRGFEEVTGEVVVIQNPECAYVGRVLETVVSQVTDQDYLSFHCYSMNAKETEDYQQGTGVPPLLPKASRQHGVSGWFNHVRYRPVGYHFCAAMSTKNLAALNGFDPAYADGLGYDDDDLVRRVEAHLDAQVTYVAMPFVVHQDHPEVIPFDPQHPGVIRNRGIFEARWNHWKENR